MGQTGHGTQSAHQVGQHLEYVVHFLVRVVLAGGEGVEAVALVLRHPIELRVLGKARSGRQDEGQGQQRPTGAVAHVWGFRRKRISSGFWAVVFLMVTTFWAGW